MDLKVQNKSVLITAASKGLGRACALEFAKEGANVTIASRNAIELEKTASEIHNITGNSVNFVVMDITKENDIHRGIEEAVSYGNGIDILITNTGGPPKGTFDNFSDTDWLRAIDLNLLSVIRLIRGTLPYMKEKGSGRIVNIGSSSIKQPIFDNILSNTLRSGVYSLMKSLSMELANEGILVNTVGPGRILTDRVKETDQQRSELSGKTLEEIQLASISQIPMNRYGDPEEFAKVVAFIGSFANTYITGQSLFVDGGLIKAI